MRLLQIAFSLTSALVAAVNACVFIWQVNGLHKVPVRAIVYHYDKVAAPVLPPVWSSSEDAKFNIFQVISEAAHRMRGLPYHPDSNMQESSVRNVFTAVEHSTSAQKPL